jgi:hypothetical protein
MSKLTTDYSNTFIKKYKKMIEAVGQAKSNKPLKKKISGGTGG